ncbi:MAG: hypothetical protein GY851_01735, partial [bacterium]|nr:hypothetical protein [bacterium]
NPTATTAVYGPAATVNAWTNLNISAVTGAQEVWAVCAIEQTAGVAVFHTAVRQDGEVVEWYSAANWPHGGTRASHAAGTKTTMVSALTSAAGVIEWRTNSNANTCKVYVLGWLDITTDATNIFTGAYPVGWTAKDLSGVVGAQRAFLITEWHRTAGNQNTIALRPGDEAADWLTAAGFVSAGCNQDGDEAINIYGSPLCVCDDTGSVDYKGDPAGVPTGQLDMLAWAAASTPTSKTVFPAGAPPLAYTDLDLSTGPGGATGLSAEGLVMLMVHRAAVGGSTILSFRTNGETLDYQSTVGADSHGMNGCALNNNATTFVVLPCDSSAKVEWMADNNATNIDISIVGWILSNEGPVFSNGFPSGVTLSGATAFSVDMTDADGPGIDLSTLDVRVHIAGYTRECILGGV